MRPAMLIALTLACVSRGDTLQIPVPRRAVRAPGPKLVAAAEADHSSAAEPNQRMLLGAAFLQSSCFGVIAQALPSAIMQQQGLASAAMTLGQLASASACAELLLSGTFGKISDAVGRKPLLIASPAVAVAARSVVIFVGPQVGVRVRVKG